MGFADLRAWLDRFEAAGELKRIKAEVNWDREIGAIARRSFTAKGPALLFENIVGYQNTVCRTLATALLHKRARLAMVLGFPPNASVRELVQYVRQKNREAIPPVEVKTGPVKENILRGQDVDLYQFPAPQWHFRDGGRYILTFAGIVTRDPDTGVMNVGVYRGMIGQRNTIPVLIVASQHGGQTFSKYSQRKQPMPVAAVIGYDLEFYELLPRLYPHADARSWFAGKEAAIRTTAFRNGSLQGAYFIIAARALGLDCGPMSGFDNAKVDAEFFPDGQWKSNFLCGIGKGDPAKLRQRYGRFEFDDVCRIL